MGGIGGNLGWVSDAVGVGGGVGWHVHVGPVFDRHFVFGCRMKMSGMHRARWSDLMAGWNSLTRHRKRQEGRGVSRSSSSSSSSTADSYREEEHHDFLLDQEAGIEGGQRMSVLGVRAFWL